MSVGAADGSALGAYVGASVGTADGTLVVVGTSVLVVGWCALARCSSVFACSPVGGTVGGMLGGAVLWVPGHLCRSSTPWPLACSLVRHDKFGMKRQFGWAQHLAFLLPPEKAEQSLVDGVGAGAGLLLRHTVYGI